MFTRVFIVIWMAMALMAFWVGRIEFDTLILSMFLYSIAYTLMDIKEQTRKKERE